MILLLLIVYQLYPYCTPASREEVVSQRAPWDFFAKAGRDNRGGSASESVPLEAAGSRVIAPQYCRFSTHFFSTTCVYFGSW